MLHDELAGAGDVAVAARRGQLGVVGDVELAPPVVLGDGLPPQRRDAQPLVGVGELRAATEPDEVAVVAVAGLEELGQARRVLGDDLGQPLRVAGEHRQIGVRDVADRRVGHPELDDAPGLEHLVGELDGERRRDEAAVRVAADDVVARQPDKGIGDVRGLDPELLGHLRRLQRSVQRAAPGQHVATHRLVGLLLADALEPAEPAPVVGQRRAVVSGCDGHVGEEHRVRASGDRLAHLALEARERSLQHGDAVASDVVVEVGELVALAREPVREVLLGLREDVDDERAGLHHRRLCLAGLVQADQDHRRLHRQRAERAGRGAEPAAVDGGRDDGDAAGEPADHVAEDLLVRDRPHVGLGHRTPSLRSVGNDRGRRDMVRRKPLTDSPPSPPLASRRSRPGRAASPVVRW